MRIKKKLFLTLFMSFTLVLLFPILAETALYHGMQSMIREDADRSNQAMLHQIQLMVDGKLREAEQLATQLSLHPRVQLMVKRMHDQAAPTVYEYKQLLDTLNLYKPSTDFILDYYIYLREQDTVVSPYTKADSATFYANYYKYETATEQDWLNNLQKGGSDHYYMPALPVIQKPTLASEQLITYIRPLPVGESGEASGALVLLIKEQRIKEMLEDPDDVQQTSFLITDHSGQIIASTVAGSLVDETLRKLDTIDSKKKLSFKIQEDTMRVAAIQSEQSGWRYISLSPESVFMQRVTTVQTWALWLLLFCLVFGLIGSFLFAKHYYSPLKRLLLSISSNRSIEPRSADGEYRFIEDTLQQSWHSEKQIKDILVKQKPAIQSNFLHQFIKGLTAADAIHQDSLASMGIHFESDVFTVILIEVDDPGKFSHVEGERQRSAVRFVVANVNRELIARHHLMYDVELDRNRLALLVNVHPNRLLHAFSDIKAAVEQSKSFIEESYGICTSIGIGDIHSGDVGASYAEALLALDFRLVKGRRRITHFREIPYNEQQYYYPIEIELQIMNAVKTGNFSSVSQLLDHIYDMNFESKPLSLQMGKFLAFNMMSTLMKIWNASPERFENVFGNQFNPLGSLVNCGSLMELHEQVKDIYQTICEAVLADKQDPGVILVDKIIEYIELHYSNNSLGLNTIADYFKLTPPYLSGLFKKHQGHNVSDFIMRLRVDKARELLLGDQLMLHEVAHRVGYANAAGFIRVFKKYMGVTPGKYREHMTQTAQQNAAVES
ncbi:hypothetical protein B1748_19080 [Paenibacillus sp. MY03]|uniref:helix-turn-helix domain-containing protein n=1 Tax=Paenibacillus sp. MY03 TaxID=302980 RepID=UPI000B3D0E9D|nr:helix-turn-helix domain-containing protein [Paenibacillus sp. MY03]OUS75009.1 hypothetical protein B1748_19080 [Paenibacillus sp. MY03]